MFHKQKIDYEKDLNDKQKENYNYHKLSAVLADYGYTTLKLSDDWQSADCISVHRDGSSIKIQLKGRFHLNKDYINKDLWIGYPNWVAGEWYLYPHDKLLEELKKNQKMFGFLNSFNKNGIYHARRPSTTLSSLLQKYKL